jgi:hypothetical protein
VKEWDGVHGDPRPSLGVVPLIISEVPGLQFLCLETKDMRYL